MLRLGKIFLIRGVFNELNDLLEGLISKELAKIKICARLRENEK